MKMAVVIVTGSSGLVGSAAVKFFSDKQFDVVGIDNNMREVFFGKSGSSKQNGTEMAKTILGFKLVDADIRDYGSLEVIFRNYSSEIFAVIHCAAQPSHDWAATDPLMDFTINANGTLNLLELTRKYCPEAGFIYMSTNKVYGDLPNTFSYKEQETRWSPDLENPWQNGFTEKLSIDSSTHSLFGVSKAAADLLVQEYGLYFGLKTCVFRGGCLTGPDHAGVELHGFLSYLVKCVVMEKPYTVFGHQGKQVRDNIHTNDLVSAFWTYLLDPDPAAVYNMGGGTTSNISMLEAINSVQDISRKILTWNSSPEPRRGDHIWYVTDLTKFKQRYPSWQVKIGIEEILEEMVERELHN
jgi:CDP-paratose 2-epimerase